jgi:PAS domain S-box-containing protein
MYAFPHLPTVFLVCCILNLLLSLGLLLVYATSNTYPGFRQWVIASFFVFFSCALLSIRESLPLPPKLTTILVNLTFFAYPLLLARGLRRFTGKPSKNWIAYLSLTAVGLVALFFLYLRPDPELRVFLLSLLLVPLFADCGWLVRSVQGFAHPAVKGALIGAFGTLASWNLLRVPLGWVLPGAIGSPAAGILVQSVTLILLTAANLWISIGVTLLNYARASESLRESEERFRNLASAAFEGIIISEGGRIIEANEQALRMLGYTRAEFFGRTISSLTALGSPSLVSNLIGDEPDPGPVKQGREHILVRNNGESFPAEAQTKRVQLGERKVHITALHDLSESRHMQQALEASEERFRSAMQQSPIGMALVATDGRWLEVNPALCAIVGYTREEMLGRSFQAITHPDDQLDDSQTLGPLLAREAANYQREKRYVHKDGHAVWVQIHASVIFNPDGTPRHLVSQIVDVTARKQTEEALRHAQKMDALGTLAGGIAHDFNNILTGIMGNLQLASIDLPPDHPVQAPLREANRASVRARDHVMRVLTFSRRYQGERTVTSLGPVLLEAVQLLRASLPATIELQTLVAPDCPPVLADPAQIHQVVMNLGTNAAYAMRTRGGRITIELQGILPDRALLERHSQVKAAHRVRLVVRDNGSGMEAKVLARIFEPFFTTKAPDEGTGLGLAMVHGIVEDHGGAITVATKAGQGTTFTLYFPAAAGSTVPVVPQSPAAAPRVEAFGRDRKVMIIDDDDGVLKLGRSLLKLAGFTPVEFSHPGEALKRFGEDPGGYAAIVSDLTMPGMTGVELARSCRAIRADIPFVLTSGYLDARTQGGAQESGVTHFIRKPFDIAEFASKLRSALEGSPPA